MKTMWIRKFVRMIQKIIFATILWFIFSAGCVVAPIMSIVLLFKWKDIYVRNFVLAADRMLASLLGFSGHCALSAELVYCARFKWMRNMLDSIDENHCEISAYTEGAYCRLSDRRIGSK